MTGGMTTDVLPEQMKSTNFEFLRPDWPELAGLGGFAEAYAQPDPVAAVVKLRTFAEQLVEFIYVKLRLPRPFRANLNELLENDAFRSVIPRETVAKLHAVRIQGNHAAHGERVSTKTANWLLKEAFDLGRWLFVSEAKGTLADIPAYVEPPPGGIEESERRKEKRAILERLAAQEAQMQQLLAELDAARAKPAANEPDSQQLQFLQAEAAAAGRRAADVLSFSEADTRKRLVDSMLAEVGWDLANPEEVRQEFEVLYQPTDSEKGYADYVLLDESGKSMAVIEAKKTAANAERGRTQAKLYADGLEKQFGQRPVIYYTNGYDIWLWDDAQNEPPRLVYGFHSRDSLQYLHFQRAQRKPLSQIGGNIKITERNYQLEGIRRVVEKFAEKKRRALIVQATGTGKTRVAVSLCDALIGANWAKRILFLCDRRELRKQAHNAFKEFLPGAPRTFVTAETAQDRDKRIYLATYPAMMKCYATFDVGFFDLVIADESHRSIYNRYRDLIEYFDAYKLGLTATPVKFVNRHTYDLFGCEAEDPTFNYSYDEAIKQGFLVPFEVETHTTPFLREGIKYSQMTAEQREQLNEEEPDPESIEYNREAVDKRVFNKDTNRHILRNLMERGIRDASGTRPGKSILFARNHNHAILLQNLFDEMYPQYGGKFCRVIDNYDPRAEELIDEFKDPASELTIAISVDMLDTGIDVPEIVNLVFAKPVYSFVKFWQMIGRGTRLRKDLFGPGRDKQRFLIFDHWGNFEWFEQNYKPTEPTTTKSLKQRVFEARVELAQAALDAQDLPTFNQTITLISQDISALPEKSIAVREKWREVKEVARPEVLERFEPGTKARLQHEIAPLMQWVNIAGHEEAHRFDLLIAETQAEQLRGSSRLADLKDELIDRVSRLRVNLSQVQAKLPVIERVKRADFWSSVTPAALDDVREELRGVAQYYQSTAEPKRGPKVIDVHEDESLIERHPHFPKLEGLELVAYRERVLKVLTGLFETNDTLRKIKAGQPVAPTDLEALCSLVLTQDPQLDLHDLAEYYPEFAGHLDRAIRGIIGVEAPQVRDRFAAFIQTHPHLASHQIKFLDLLQNHIARYGTIDVARLYEAPFTDLNSDGLDGVFPDEAQAQQLLEIVNSFQTIAEPASPTDQIDSANPEGTP